MAVVGDRVLPVEAKAVFPSDATSPALELRLAVVDDVPQCREIRITSKEGGREVRTSDLRAVQLERWIEDLFASVAARVEHVDADAVIVSAVDEHDEKRVAEARLGSCNERARLPDAQSPRRCSRLSLRSTASMSTASRRTQSAERSASSTERQRSTCRERALRGSCRQPLLARGRRDGKRREAP